MIDMDFVLGLSIKAKLTFAVSSWRGAGVQPWLVDTMQLKWPSTHYSRFMAWYGGWDNR